MSTKVGLIGVGAMGEPMAAALMAKGFTVTVCAHNNRAPLHRLVAAGARDGESPAGVASASDVVVTMVPDAPQVEESIFGEHGALGGARPDTLFIDMSTISPVSTRPRRSACRTLHAGPCPVGSRRRPRKQSSFR